MQEPLSRRSFLKAGAATLASLPFIHMPTIKVYHIGLQLYSVRDDMQKDPVATLESVSRIGYREVEHANYADRRFYGFSAADFRKLLDSHGLSMPTSHTLFQKKHWLTNQKEVSDEWKMTLEDALVVGQKYIFSPVFDWNMDNPDELKRGIEAYNHCGEACREAGLRFGYHNHTDDLMKKYQGQPALDYMLAEWDPVSVCMQLDLCNASLGGVDPMVWLRKHPLRFESLHMKDRHKSAPESTLLGEGTLNLEEIIAFANKNTLVKHWVIEQESYHGKSPLEAAQYNLNRFKALISPKNNPFPG